MKRHQELLHVTHCQLQAALRHLSLPKAELISDCAGPHCRAGGDALKKAEACRGHAGTAAHGENSV